MGEVDDTAFIQEVEHRPKPTIIEAEGIPIIDLSLLSSSNPDDLSRIVYEIGDACEKWGFFQVINHGVPFELRQKMESASRKFFALPKEEKLKVRRDEVNPLGYYDTEYTKNVRDWKELFDIVIKSPKLQADDDDDDDELKLNNRWPNYPPELRETCEEYAKKTEEVCFKLLELISLSLGLPRNRMHTFFVEKANFIRLNYYAPCPIPHLALGLGRHKDGGALTLLAQDDVGGLEVKRKTDGEWIRVKPTPDAYIVNVGDILQVWSNDKYESVEHRVMVNSKRERFSIPFFFNPPLNTWVEPLPELINENNPAKFKPYNWGEFFTARKSSNFKSLDAENIQIHHFRI